MIKQGRHWGVATFGLTSDNVSQAQSMRGIILSDIQYIVNEAGSK